MALSPQEQSIVQFGQQSGKSPDEITQAVSKFRQQQQQLALNVNSAPATTDMARVEEFNDKSRVGQIFTKEFLNEVPEEAYNTLVGGALKFIKSAVEAPANIVQGLQGKELTQTEGRDPFTGNPITSIQTDFQNQVLPAVESGQMTPLQGVAQTVGDTVIGAVDLVGAGELASGAIKGAKAVGTLAKDAASVATTATKEVVGTALEKTGQKIQNVVIKPSQRDMKDGFKIENVVKYDVGGTLPETIAKTHTKMNALVQELNSKLKGATNKLDLKKTYEKTLKALGGDKAMSFGDNSAISRVIKSLKSEINQVSRTGQVDLVRGTNIKRGAGSKGAWAYNRPEADSSAIEKVYTEFYRQLKQDIENAAPDGVREINKQISELIPINNAALRRMTIEERNNALSLMDNIGLVSSVFDPRALLLFGANKAMKSGRVGQFLTKTGQKLKGTKSISPTASPISEVRQSKLLSSIGSKPQAKLKSSEISTGSKIPHKEIGDIEIIDGKSTVNGKSGYGLSKIKSDHPDVMPFLKEAIKLGKIVERLPERIILEAKVSNGKTIRLVVDEQLFNKKKTFLNNAYFKSNE